MAHYDWMYETFTMKETEEEIKRASNWIKELTTKKETLLLDLEKVEAEYTKKVLHEKLKSIEDGITKCQKKLKGWNTVKTRIEKGNSLSYSEAHTIANM